MIGKPEWFTYRIFGWGLRPKTWQGWVYIAIIAGLIGGVMSITLNNTLKMYVFAIIMAIVAIDVIHIMMQLPKKHDERQNHQQLIIERNCSFAAIFALVGIAIYQGYTNRAVIAAGGLGFDVSLLVILGAMFVTKIVSWIYVEKMM